MLFEKQMPDRIVDYVFSRTCLVDITSGATNAFFKSAAEMPYWSISDIKEVFYWICSPLNTVGSGVGSLLSIILS